MSKGDRKNVRIEKRAANSKTKKGVNRGHISTSYLVCIHLVLDSLCFICEV